MNEAGAGLEDLSDSLENTPILEPGEAESEAIDVRVSQLDPGLALIVDRWQMLPAEVQRELLALVRELGGDSP